jgi:hypothetical protein
MTYIPDECRVVYQSKDEKEMRRFSMENMGYLGKDVSYLKL